MAVFTITKTEHRNWYAHVDSNAVLFSASDSNGNKVCKMEIPLECFKLLTDSQVNTVLQAALVSYANSIAGIHPPDDPVIATRAATFEGMQITIG